MKISWGKLSGKLGIAYFLGGLLLVFLGWNGAATYDRVPSQVPYLVSGGIAGLCLVVIGASVLVASSAREDSAALGATVAELREAVERMTAGQGGSASGPARAVTAAAPDADADADAVVAGPTSYHRPGCRLVEGQAEATPTSAVAAAAGGLSACRVCTPDGPAGQPSS